jgi:inosose dehydratase
MGKTTRRNFMKRSGLGLAMAAFSSTMAALHKYPETSRRSESRLKQRLARMNLGMASYTFRKFSLVDTVAMTNRLGLERIAFKSFHLPLESADEEIRSVAARVRATGLDLYGCGVVYMQNKEEVERAFHYAQKAGMRMIIGAPDPNLLEMVNKMVNKYDIKLAIHNHGPDDEHYPTPESAYVKIKDLDPHVGLCIDIGHTMRAGVDPSVSAEKFADRLLDVHVKDVTAAAKEGQTIEIGRGVIDIPKFLKTLLKLNYEGSVSFEFEKDPDDPLPGVAESVGYVRGVLAAI